MSWSEPILHVDMDSFFVEVERLADKSLIDRPVAVGGAGERGVVASASYEARRFGVKSAQPMAVARRLCPELVVVPTSHGRYSDVSAEVFSIFRSFTPTVEGLSLDEAFLDIAGLRKHYRGPVAVAEDVRRRIRDELGLPASVGVSGVKFVAKLASEDAKPDGLLHVPVDTQLEYLHPLPVGRMWGVGPATLAALERLGVATVGDLANVPQDALVSTVGSAVGEHLYSLAHGRDPRPVNPDSASKSISVEQTFQRDLEDIDTVESSLLGQAQTLSGRLRRAGLRTRTVNLKVRFADFRTITRSRTLPRGLDGSRDLYKVCLELVSEASISEPVRLLGIAGTTLEPASTPSQLDIDSSQEWESVEDAVAGVRERFGADSVGPARLAKGPNRLTTDEEP